MKRNIIQKDFIFYELNKTDFTAEIIYSPKARGDIIFPPTINHQSNDYKIINIKEGSFKNNTKVKSIKFFNDSKLQTISKNAFSSSKIKNINIPSSVEELEDGWCRKTPSLKNVTISPENLNFKYLDENQQIIVGKSDKSTDIFDTIYFANRNIEYAIIPQSIKYIKPFAFEKCKKLQRIEISEDSNLRSIGRKSFSFSKIRSIYIPSSVEDLEYGWCCNIRQLEAVLISPKNRNFKYFDEKHQIIVGKSNKSSDFFDTIYFVDRNIKYIIIPRSIKYIRSYSFEYCRFLTTIKFSKDSEIISIAKKSFRYSDIKSIFIPSTVEELEDGWCTSAFQLKTVTISPESRNFKYLDEKHQIIVGKSDKFSDDFDTICFANRNIENAIIPQSIKYIGSSSFDSCQIMTTIEFSKDSQIISIGFSAFNGSAIDKITIPKSVVQIQKNCFQYCSMLNSVVFEEGSKLVSLEKNLFGLCNNLKVIELPKNSALRSIHECLINETRVKNIFIPSCVDEIECDFCKNRKISIEISPQNPNFKYLDEEHQIIVGKSDKFSDNFDTIYFVNDNIKQLTIPNSIKYIKSHAFERCKKLKRIKISDDSKIESIEEFAFSNCGIHKIYFPPSLEYLDEDWCADAEILETVIISPHNPHFKYLDEKHQIIVGKSDKFSDNFDTIYFADRLIERFKIPKNIKYIKSHSFRNCYDLTSLEFDENSELEIIGKCAFNDIGINKITIPKSVRKIQKEAFISCSSLLRFELEKGSKLRSFKFGIFSICLNLNTLIIPNDSSLKKLDVLSLANTRIANIFIPESFEQFEDNWSMNSAHLKTLTISPNNKNFKYLDEEHQIIVGKSDKFSDDFDTIYFVNRDTKNAIIPNSIKYIKKNSFEYCNLLKKVDILEGSKLKSLEVYSFKNSLIERIKIPSSVIELKDGWCSYVPNLISVEISPQNPNFKYLDKEHQIIVGKSDKFSDDFDTIYFVSRYIKYVTIPNSIKYIKSHSFEQCKILKTIDIPNDSQIESIGVLAFAYSSIICFKLPKNILLYDNNFLYDCNKLRNLEFIGDKFINKMGGIFKSNTIDIASFPNIQTLDIYTADFADYLQGNFVLYVNSNAKVSIINDVDDNDDYDDDTDDDDDDDSYNDNDSDSS